MGLSQTSPIPRSPDGDKNYINLQERQSAGKVYLNVVRYTGNYGHDKKLKTQVTAWIMAMYIILVMFVSSYEKP